MKKFYALTGGSIQVCFVVASLLTFVLAVPIIALTTSQLRA